MRAGEYRRGDMRAFFRSLAEPAANPPVTMIIRFGRDGDTRCENVTSRDHDTDVIDQQDPRDRADRVLIEQIASERDSHAMQTLYEHYRSRLVPFLYRLSTDHALVEEAYNDVMLRVWDKASQYQGRSKVSSWVFSIAYRACLRMLKRRSRDAIRLVEYIEQNRPDNTAGITGSDTEVDCELIQQALLHLPAKQRMVLELCYFQGYSMEEIGQIMSCPANTVKTRLHHGRRKIKAYLESNNPGFSL